MSQDSDSFARAPQTRILVFNFFGSVMDRGIPQYTRDIGEAMRRRGHETVELACPRLCRRLPRAIRNLLFVVFEQLVAPAMRVFRGCAVTVYPYNSAGVIDALIGRSVLVIHDLMPNARSNTSLAARYIRVTQAVQRSLARPVCAASEHTLAQLRRIARFSGCPLYLWSNPFYQFEHALAESNFESAASTAGPKRILLCSGLAQNKDYAGALRLFARSRRLRDARLYVIGFGDDAHLARRRVARLPAEVSRRIVILPRLSLADVAVQYLRSDVVWVHSHNEGFGRSIIEGRLSGRPVMASRIRAFVKLAVPGLTLYQNSTFDEDIVSALEPADPPSCISIVDYHTRFEANICAVIGRFARRGATAYRQTSERDAAGEPIRVGARDSR